MSYKNRIVVILKNREERDKFLTSSNDNGVMNRPVWQLMNRLLMFKDCQHGDLSNAEWFERELLIYQAVLF